MSMTGMALWASSERGMVQTVMIKVVSMYPEACGLSTAAFLS